MDDSRMIRDLLEQMLIQLGYRVESASDGKEAIDKYENARESGDPFDALILDLTIPGAMGGKETIRRLTEIDPQVKAIVSSGYSSDPIMSDFRKYGYSGVIAKPYDIKKLSETVLSVLAEADK